MILIYAFSNQWGTNISRRTLLELQKYIKSSQITYQIIYFHPRQFFEKYIKNNYYDLIVGLGDLYGNFHQIRIETQAKNCYSNNSIYPFSPIIIDLKIPVVDNYDSQFFTISSHMGTYNCNWIAYSTQLYLDQHRLNTSHHSFHD
jgi:pyrrolidone-carboxylate peptidase